MTMTNAPTRADVTAAQAAYDQAVKELQSVKSRQRTLEREWIYELASGERRDLSGGGLGVRDEAGFDIAAQQLSDERLSAAHTAKLAEGQLRTTRLASANSELAKLTPEHQAAADAVRSGLTSLEAAVLDLVEQMWALDELVGVERRVASRMTDVATRGVLNGAEQDELRKHIASFLGDAHVPTRVDSNVDLESTQRPPIVLFDDQKLEVFAQGVYESLVWAGIRGREHGMNAPLGDTTLREVLARRTSQVEA
jgi:hypothetical protein